VSAIPLSLIGDALAACELAYNPPWGGLTFEDPSGAFARITETPAAIIVAYRGTDEARDWLKNIRAYPWPYGGAVAHRGFMRGHQSIWPRIITELSRRDSQPAKDLIVTGHSLGAALAELSCLFLSRYPGSVSMVGFGKPNVFFRPRSPKLQHLSHQISVVSGSAAVHVDTRRLRLLGRLDRGRHDAHALGH
jgi:hypothetical protein